MLSNSSDGLFYNRLCAVIVCCDDVCLNESISTAGSHAVCVTGFLQKPAGCLLMNRSSTFRRVQEQRDLISTALPALSAGHVRLRPLYTVTSARRPSQASMHHHQCYITACGMRSILWLLLLLLAQLHISSLLEFSKENCPAVVRSHSSEPVFYLKKRSAVFISLAHLPDASDNFNRMGKTCFCSDAFPDILF